MNVLFVFVLVIVLVVSLTVWLILEPGRASACDNSAAYHLGYIGLGLNPVQKQITVHTEYGNLSGSYQRSPVLKHLYLTNGVYEPAVVAELEVRFFCSCCCILHGRGCNPLFWFFFWLTATG